MGKGIEAARADSPLHAQIMDDFKDQIILALIRRAGGKVSIPVSEVDSTGGLVLFLSLDGGTFNLELRAKQ